MIPTLGLLIAIYTIARLLQAPMEIWDKPQKWWVLLVSLFAIPAIAFLAFSLLWSGLTTSVPDVSGLGR